MPAPLGPGCAGILAVGQVVSPARPLSSLFSSLPCFYTGDSHVSVPGTPQWPMTRQDDCCGRKRGITEDENNMADNYCCHFDQSNASGDVSVQPRSVTARFAHLTTRVALTSIGCWSAICA